MSGKVLEFKPKVQTDEERAVEQAMRDYDTPRMFVQENGLYGIMCSGCQTHVDLDPVGEREAIRLRTLGEAYEKAKAEGISMEEYMRRMMEGVPA